MSFLLRFIRGTERARIAEQFRHQTTVLGRHCQGTKAWYAIGRAEVPLVLGDLDKVANDGVGDPGSAQRRKTTN